MPAVMSEGGIVFDTEAELGEFLSGIRVPSEILQLGGEATDRYYEWCLKEGQAPTTTFSETLAIWYARKSSVGTKASDRAFQEGQIGRYQGNERWLKIARKKYKKATGKDLPTGLMYISQIARFPQDPMAWVADRSELAARAKALGRGIDEMGIQANEAVDMRSEKKPGLSEDLVQRHLRKAVADPANIGKDVGELRHKIIEKHAFNPKRE